MAERRMFSKKVIGSDEFTDMPLTTQALYFHLSMYADDEGFINNPRQIQRAIGATRDDLTLLMSKRFIIPFDSGIVVIRHWRIHNYIQRDRFHDTLCTEEKSLLSTLDSGEYTEGEAHSNGVVSIIDTTCIQPVHEMDTEVRLGKVNTGKVNNICGTLPTCIQPDNRTSPTNGKKKSQRFTKPTLEEVRTYCNERKNGISPNKFIDFYDANGWKVGKNPMRDWKATVRYWERQNSGNSKTSSPTEKDYYAGSHTPEELLGWTAGGEHNG